MRPFARNERGMQLSRGKAVNIFATVNLKIEYRDDRFYVSSADVPGLWLWGKDLDLLMRNVAPAILSLLKYNGPHERK